MVMTTMTNMMVTMVTTIGDDGDVHLVVLLRIGSCWMPTRMREREVERTVGPLQTVHWS